MRMHGKIKRLELTQIKNAQRWGIPSFLPHSLTNRRNVSSSNDYALTHQYKQANPHTRGHTH